MSQLLVSELRYEMSFC